MRKFFTSLFDVCIRIAQLIVAIAQALRGYSYNHLSVPNNWTISMSFHDNLSETSPFCCSQQHSLAVTSGRLKFVECGMQHGNMLPPVEPVE